MTPAPSTKSHVAVDTSKDNESTSSRLAVPSSDQGEKQYSTSGWTEALDYEVWDEVRRGQRVSEGI